MKILLVVSGMTPQIITETVYGLAVAPEDGVEPWIPDEVHVLSTKSGITQIRGALIDKSRLDGLCAEYDLPKIRFDDSCLHTFQREYKDSEGNTVSEDLEDIKSKEDSSTVADRICEKVRELTSDDNVELHVSIAGGEVKFEVLTNEKFIQNVDNKMNEVNQRNNENNVMVKAVNESLGAIVISGV